MLFLCTGNSCRSIIGECLVSHLGGPGWRGFSAGSRPTGQVHPGAVSVLQEAGVEVAGCNSKSWHSLSGHSFSLVITVCDSAAGEACPRWAGRGLRLHWPLPDPAQAPALAQQAAFQATLAELQVGEAARPAPSNPAQRRVAQLVTINFAQLTDSQVAEQLAAISRNKDQ